MKHTSENSRPYKERGSEESEQVRQDHAVAEPAPPAPAMDEFQPVVRPGPMPETGGPGPMPGAEPVTHEDLRQAMEDVRSGMPRHAVDEDRFQGAVEALDGKIDSSRRELIGEIKAMDGKIEAMDGKLSGKIEALDGKLSGKIEALDGKIEAVDKKLSGKIEALDGKIEALDGKLSGKIEGLDGKIEAVDKKLSGEIKVLDGKIDAVDKKLSGKIEGLDIKIEGSRRELMAEIKGMSGKMVTLADFSRQNATMVRSFVFLAVSLLGAVTGLIFWLIRSLPS